MNNKKLRLKLNELSGEYKNDKDYFKKYFLVKILKDNFNVEFVDNISKADVICENCSRGGNLNFLKDKKRKIILFSGEDLFKKRDVFNLIESFIHKLGVKDRKWEIMDRIDSILPSFLSSIPIIYFLPKHLKFVKKIIKGKVKNAYAIVSNDLRGRNILIMPCFLYVLYYHMPKLIKKTKQKLKKRKKFCAFIVSSNSSRERVSFFKKLSKYKKVDSYGRVQNNMGDAIFNTHWDNNIEIFKSYKFVICFENSFRKEYICEKLQKAMLAGAIPVYRGASNIGEYFNTKSFINYNDYGSYDKMIEKIIELDKDDKKYKEMGSEPWFKDNKIPKIIKKKKKELIKFYEKVLGETSR